MREVILFRTLSDGDLYFIERIEQAESMADGKEMNVPGPLVNALIAHVNRLPGLSRRGMKLCGRRS